MPGDFEGLFDNNPDLFDVIGILEVSPDGWGLVRRGSLGPDVYVPCAFVEDYALKTGHRVAGRARRPQETEQRPILTYFNSAQS